MKPKTKLDLENEIRRLKQDLAAVKARLVAAKIIECHFDGREYVACPMTHSQWLAVQDIVCDYVSRLAGEGWIIAQDCGGYSEGGTTTYELAVFPVHDEIPPYDGWLVRYRLSDLEGTSIESYSGLRKVRNIER